MYTRATVLVAVLSVSFSACIQESSVAPAVEVVTTSTTSVAQPAIRNASVEQVALVEWALSSFDRAGLERPPVHSISFPPTDGCDESHMGTFSVGSLGCSIEICVESDSLVNRSDVPLVARRTLLHELGHCWAHEFVDDSVRRKFLELRDIDSWSNARFWQDKGCEHAAEIVMWGLIDAPVLVRVPDHECFELLDAFQTLTGNPAIQRRIDCTNDPIDYYSSD